MLSKILKSKCGDPVSPPCAAQFGIAEKDIGHDFKGKTYRNIALVRVNGTKKLAN